MAHKVLISNHVWVSILGGALAGFFLVRLAFFPAVDPLAQVVPVVMYTELEKDGSIDPRPGGSIPPVRKGERFRLAFWKQERYQGRLSEAAVRRICEGEKAHSLETRLKPWAKAEMARALGGVNRSVAELNIIIDGEERDIRRKLSARDGRHFVLDAQPAVDDLAFRDYRKAVKLAERGKGTIWSGGADEGRTSHYIVLWQEWPRYKRLLEQRTAAIEDRQRAVREWVVAAFERSGMTILDT